MNSNAKIDSFLVETCRIIRVFGVIDETFSAVSFSKYTEAVVVIDLDGVRDITPTGLDKWAKLPDRLAASERYIASCRPEVMRAYAANDAFLSVGTLVSAYGEYICGKCRSRSDVLFDLVKQRRAIVSRQIQTGRCASCGSVATLDPRDTASLDRAAKLPLGDVSSAALHALAATGDGSAPVRAVRTTTNGVTMVSLSGQIGSGSRLKRLLHGVTGTTCVNLKEVTRVSGKGLRQLHALATLPEASVLLARVPLSIAECLGATRPTDAAPVRVCSIVVGATCAACGRSGSTEVRLMPRGGRLVPTPIDHCGACGEHLVEDEDLDACGGLVTAPMPAAIAAQLDGVEATAKPALPMSSGTAGQLEFVKQLGAGGMAEVFLARQKGLEGFSKDVVIKRIIPEYAERQEFVQMLLREARLAARIIHPNVVQIYDLGHDGRQYYIAMEYVRGVDLRTVLQATRKLGRFVPVHIACRIAADICAGLHAAHACTREDGEPLGIIHRDVSPRNILISDSGAVKVADFGIATTIADEYERTRPGIVKGKPTYIAPERYQHDRPDPRIDVWAAGVVLYELLTGERPHAPRGALPPNPSTQRSDIPPHLDAIVARALAPDPDQRYPTARALQLDLESFIAELRRAASSSQVASWLVELTTPNDEPTTGGSLRPEGDSNSWSELKDLREKLAGIGKRLGHLVEKRKNRGAP